MDDSFDEQAVEARYFQCFFYKGLAVYNGKFARTSNFCMLNADVDEGRCNVVNFCEVEMEPWAG